MELKFYTEERRQVGVRNYNDLQRANHFSKTYNLEVYLGGIPLGKLCIRLSSMPPLKSRCFLSGGCFGEGLPMVFELDTFKSFIGRTDLTLENFLKYSLRIKKVKVIEAEDDTYSEKAYKALQVKMEEQRDEYERVLIFRARTEPYGRYIMMPKYVMFSREIL